MIWKDSDEILKHYKNGQFQGVNLGITDVNPKFIIGLCINPKIVATDWKMENLKKAVELNGWDDQYANSISLIQLPTGEYVVTPGGNHMAMLSKQLGMASIKAKVYRLFPINIFPSNILNTVQSLQKEAERIQSDLSTLGPESEEAYDLINRLDKIQLEEINQTFLDYLILEKLI
ncbi:hypothetical protein ABES03_14180 [Neobacillus rhizosphaerae]|uniref:hypothetical protein n=1 Tax=Neobacillus rhizosphaerae TaxID=2880965 RepID=UPI003D2C1607